MNIRTIYTLAISTGISTTVLAAGHGGGGGHSGGGHSSGGGHYSGGGIVRSSAVHSSPSVVRSSPTVVHSSPSSSAGVIRNSPNSSAAVVRSSPSVSSSSVSRVSPTATASTPFATVHPVSPASKASINGSTVTVNHTVNVYGNGSSPYYAGSGYRYGGSGYYSPYGYRYGYGSPYGFGLGIGNFRFGIGLPFSGYGYGGYGYGRYGYGGFGYGGYGSGGYGMSQPGYYAGYNTGQVIAVQPQPNAVVQNPNPQQQQPQATDYFTNGQQLLAEGKLQDGLQALRHAVVDNPNNGQVAAVTSQALLANGNYEEAAGAAQQALNLLPEDQWMTTLSKASNLIDTKTTTEALRQAIAKTPDAPAPRFLAGYQSFAAGDYIQAVAELDAVLKIAPQEPVATKLRAAAQKQLGR
jgi:hypothetical protein